MNKRKTRFFITMLAVMLCMTAFSTVAYAGGGEEIPASVSNPKSTPKPTAPKPLTPDGTGTVIDNVTSEDNKEFFTITTPSKHVFYLIIDRQREAENVYFLDAVTEKDLLALTETSEGSERTVSTPKPKPTPELEPEPTPKPEQKSNMGGIIVVLLIIAVIGVGGAFYYFKVIKSKPASKGSTDLDEYDFDDEDEEDSAEVEEEASFLKEADAADTETRDDPQ